MIRACAFLGLLPTLCAAAAWPQLPAPEAARVEPVGEQLRLNGVPMRIQRVLVAQPPQAVARQYRAALGARHAAQRMGGRLVLAQGRDEHFITVSIRPLAPGVTEALVSVADAREARLAADRPRGLRLPADSAVLSDMESVDAGKRSRQLVLSNAHSIAANRDALERELAARGMRPDGPPVRQDAADFVQFFAGARREARLTLVRREGATQAVLTIVETP